MAPVFAQCQLKLFEELERREPGAWSLAMPGDDLRFPGQTVAEHRSVEMQLYQVLPAPADDVPFQDVIEFRARYASELLSLRHAMDGMYEQLIQATDPARARGTLIEQLNCAVRDVEAALDGSKVNRWRLNLAVEIKPTDLVERALQGAGVAALIGAPIALGAAVGAVASTIGFRVRQVATPDAARSGPFAYLYQARRELST